MTSHRQQEEKFDLAFEPATDFDAREFVGNAVLGLHHHMAPPDEPLWPAEPVS